MSEPCGHNSYWTTAYQKCVMCENANVKAHVEEWEIRCLTAERQLAAVIEKEKEFWSRCIINGIVVAPVWVYSQFDETGNVRDKHFVGVQYVAFSFDGNFAVGPDYYVQIEEGQTGMDRLFNTPEEALASKEETHE